MMHLALQYPLDALQTERLLEFCLRRGADCFSVHFLFGNEAELRHIIAIEERLMPFRLGRRLLEQTVWRNNERFVQTECWALNSETVRLVRVACDDSLSNYSPGRFLEDWTFYRQGGLFLGFVSHEQYAFLRLSDEEFEAFKPLGIGHTVV